MTKAKIVLSIFAGLVVVACQTTRDAVRIDNVPMYGQPALERPAAHKQADQAFIADAMAAMRKHRGNSTRRQASEEWWLVGESFMQERNIDFAMRRYNQAWLLDPENYQPYWGFGRAMLAQEQLDIAIKNFERALARLDNPKHKVALTVDSATAYSVRGAFHTKEGLRTAAQDFSRANGLFEDSVKANPAHPNIYRRWAMALFREGRYADTWVKVKAARDRNARPFPQGFLAALSANLREPR